MKRSIIKTAKSLNEAIEDGLKEINRKKSDVEIEVIEEGKSGILGIIGAKDAVVKIIYEDDLKLENSIIDESLSEMEDDIELDELDINSELPDDKEFDKLKKEIEEYDQTEMELEDFDESNEDFSEYGEVEDIEEEIILSKKSEEQIIDEENSDLEDINEPKNEKSEKVSKESFDKEELLDDDQISDVEKFYKAKEFLGKIFENMHIEAKIYGDLDGDDHMNFDVRVDKSETGIAIGKKAQTLNAIETILRKSIANGERYPKVSLDINSYKKRRDEKTKNLANKIAHSAVKDHKSKKLKPMNAYDRRLIHKEISGYESLVSHSEGKEPYRYVVIDVKEKTQE